MYHGGSTFAREAGGSCVSTMYDYDAPSDGLANLNQPKDGHLKQLHDVLHSLEKIITHGNVTNTDFGNSVKAPVYTFNVTSVCFLENSYTTTDATITYQGAQHNVPAWSVSILPDCKMEVYNTAKVNTQTSVMVKKPNNAENEPICLSWSWRAETIDDTVVDSKGKKSANKIVDQKANNDVSDYLWYMTSTA